MPVFANPFTDEIVAKVRSLVCPPGLLPGQQGAPARDPIPAYAGFFPRTVEENQAVFALVEWKRGELRKISDRPGTTSVFTISAAV